MCVGASVGGGLLCDLGVLVQARTLASVQQLEHIHVPVQQAHNVYADGRAEHSPLPGKRSSSDSRFVERQQRWSAGLALLW